ncbi:Outer dense fiber protein 4 [Galemys pyrenaicus]|uniref:Outer dense fiber protein 4 n=1 Tax=Galemys pyrenaicus TaxID=202257 RepID=A0A8J5ZUQ2_GALPY|nr:Outer dense fiber protein 4 [Galemys pyrenaicus]
MSSLGQEEKGMSTRDLESEERAGKQDSVEESVGQECEKRCSVSGSDNARQMSTESDKPSLLPLQWKMKHSSRWLEQVLASELSLIAFILLLVMVFSKKWLYLSGSRFYQRWPMNVSTRIYTSAHIMSMGLLPICKVKRCPNSENGQDSFKLWTNHPIFGLAKITFSLTVGLGFILTIWLHLLYLPVCQKLPMFAWIGTVMSFSEVTFIFSTLMLFPINLWIFELKKNLSIPIGWSYFIGWLVFILYLTCGILCYFNHKHFWGLIQIHPSDTESISSNDSSTQNTEEITSNVLNVSVNQEGVLDPGQGTSSLDSESKKALSEPLDSDSKKEFSGQLDSESKNISEPLDSEPKSKFSEPLDSEPKSKFSEPLDSEPKSKFSEPPDSESKKTFSEPLDSEPKSKFSEPPDSESKKTFSEPLDSEPKSKFSEPPDSE